MSRSNQLRRLPAILFLLVATVVSNAASAIVTYEVRPNPAEERFEITMRVPRPSSTLQVQIPNWSPGAYMVADFASNMLAVSAEDGGGRRLEVAHPDKNTWSVTPPDMRDVVIHYQVKSADLVMTDGKPKRGHISGPRTYMYVVGRKTEPVELRFVDAPSDWKFATSLDPAGTHAYTAPNYDVFADAPVEMGDFGEDTFTVRGVSHQIVLFGDYAHVDRPKLKEYCQKIAEEEIRFFDDAPFKRYVFMFRVSGPNGTGAGGLEHLGSTEISFSGPVNDTVRSVTAHEFFHLWNVKRIRPAVLGPFDYIDPPHTRNLWWSEGVTSYYGDLLSRRAKINTDEEYLKHLGTVVGQLQSNPNRLKVSADDSSYNVWDRGGSQGFGGLSYYVKGELVGLCLDLKIRQVTGGKRSLDDVMRTLYKMCGKGSGPGFGEDAIKTTVNQVAGQDLSSFYDQLTRTTEEMPFNECLGYAGLTLAQADKPVITPDLGMSARGDVAGMRVRFVQPDGPAARAGIKSGDLLVALDGDSMAVRKINELKPNVSVRLTLERDGAKSEVEFTPGKTERRPYVISPDPSALTESVRLRERWLNGSQRG